MNDKSATPPLPEPAHRHARSRRAAMRPSVATGRTGWWTPLRCRRLARDRVCVAEHGHGIGGIGSVEVAALEKNAALRGCGVVKTKGRMA